MDGTLQLPLLVSQHISDCNPLTDVAEIYTWVIAGIILLEASHARQECLVTTSQSYRVLNGHMKRHFYATFVALTKMPRPHRQHRQFSCINKYSY